MGSNPVFLVAKLYNVINDLKTSIFTLNKIIFSVLSFKNLNKNIKKPSIINLKKTYSLNSISRFVYILFSLNYKFNKQNNMFRSFFRYTPNLKTNNIKYLKYLNNYYLNGLNSLWNIIKFWIFPILLLATIIYFVIVTKMLPFNKILFSWICVIMFSYWLLSGFVFFFKKYQFAKYTSVIQRFWKRSYILFWLIEGSTFCIFLFFTINASQESFYMFDQISIFKSHLYSWRLFFLKLFPSIFLIISCYLILITLKYNFFSKYNIFLLILTFFLTYLVWLEFYQFYHIINFYSNLNWIYDLDEHYWILEQEPRRTRMVNHYTMLLFILRFWHIIFIYGFWIFFVLRSCETKRIRYPLFSANYQNMIILYIFIWVPMYPWFKFFFRNIIDTPYYWFYINNRRLFFRIVLNDFKLYFYSFFKNYNNGFNYFKYFDFYYLQLNNKQVNFESFKKNVATRFLINTK